VVALCADLIGSLKFDDFKKNHPERFFQIGIAEANMIGIAAGLTIGGKIIYRNFQLLQEECMTKFVNQ
jgi:transketolase